MKTFVLYLPGRYPVDRLDFYRRLSRGAYRVAVDGGLSFFVKSGLRPHLLIGDMDSVGRRPKELLKRVEVLTFPAAKNKTDLELALDLCLKRGATRIEIAMPTVGEIDHFLGAVELLRAGPLARSLDRLERLRIVNHRFEIVALKDSLLAYRGCRGDRLSVMAVAGTVRLTLVGTEYDVSDLLLRPGESRGLRNRLAAYRASVKVKGRALVYHSFESENR